MRGAPVDEKALRRCVRCESWSPCSQGSSSPDKRRAETERAWSTSVDAFGDGGWSSLSCRFAFRMSSQVAALVQTGTPIHTARDTLKWERERGARRSGGQLARLQAACGGVLMPLVSSARDVLVGPPSAHYIRAKVLVSLSPICSVQLHCLAFPPKIEKRSIV